MMEYVREGDTIVVCSMDRLARNLADLLTTTKELQAKGVRIRFIKESIFLDASGNDAAMTKLLMSMLGAVAEFERSMIRERQREGKELAKKRGVYKGRKPTDGSIIEKAREKNRSRRSACKGRTRGRYYPLDSVPATENTFL